MPITRYQRPVTKCDMPTVNLVISGSSPPNSLNTPTNTGTMNAISASSTPSANTSTTVG